MMEFALWGYPLGHSFSQSFFRDKFKKEGYRADYLLAECPSLSEFQTWLSLHPHLRGFNITVPFKETALALVDSLTESAQAIGAINCVRINPDGSKTGHNTDSDAFRKSLTNWIGASLPSMALVLGTGGSSKAVRYALQQLGITSMAVSRDPEKGDYTWDFLNPDIIASFPLIINTTPVGMFPEIQQMPPFPVNCLSSDHFVYDLIYNPSETALLTRAKHAGASIKNGLEMLHLQAEASWNFWNS